MPNIYDNLEKVLLNALRDVLGNAVRADFCVGYFNLRGWNNLADLIDHFEGDDTSCCRVLVGMQRLPEEDMRVAQSALSDNVILDGPTRARLVAQAAQSFKEQIEFGVPNAAAEKTLRQLATQLRAKKVRVKLYLGQPLHAKLYLIQRPDNITPLVSYLGSSNLTFSGLSHQGELNVDVVEQDAAQKLQTWFDKQWKDANAYDISEQLAELIETSWAREELLSPYHVYLKMAHHLSEEARRGEREFRLPSQFQGLLMDFQSAAVSLVAHYLHWYGGVLLGDVVGLGKTLMATAVAKIFQEDDNSDTLIICPPKLTEMWEWHVQRYGLTARVLSLGKVTDVLPELMRYRLVIIDESHNVRNREGKRYRAIQEYIERCEPRVLLLTATPYNKQFTDLSNQLRLFVDEDMDLRVRPEKFFQEWRAQGFSEQDFRARFQVSTRSLRAFEQSVFAEDWRDLMRLYLVRRTRQFIMRNYAHYDAERERYYVTIQGQPTYFPKRQAVTLQFPLDEDNPDDQYARLFSERVVDVIEDLLLPRYGLSNYLVPGAERNASKEERRILENLNRAGRRLIGFSRTNLFKRLESSGHSFLLSIDRHILRNMITLHALENGLPIPIGTQDAALLDTQITDADVDFIADDETDASDPSTEPSPFQADSLNEYRARAAQVYANYRNNFRNRFGWLDARFFTRNLQQDLLQDAEALLTVLNSSGQWQPDLDTKLDTLYELLTETRPQDKVLIFTQFSDTALYLAEQLGLRGVTDLAVAVGDSDTVTLARRFSPSKNGSLRQGEQELRILISTDVLAEGQNLQDAHIMVNFDLPWAIIRLIQRSGRIDRIGQQSDTIQICSFLPAEGVEQIILLRTRLSLRLEQNREVIGSDETFFGEEAANRLRDLYTERSGVLDDDQDEDVDLASIALQVWNSASEADQRTALKLPGVVSATRRLPKDVEESNPGVIAYLRFPDRSDALVQVDQDGNLISQSLTTVFRSAACASDTKALPRAENHYELVEKAVQSALQEQSLLGGHLGSLRSTRRKVYERLKRYRENVRSQYPLLAAQMLKDLEPALNLLFNYPLTEAASNALKRQLRLGITDETLAEMLVQWHQEEHLCVIEDVKSQDPQIVCALGLIQND